MASLMKLGKSLLGFLGNQAEKNKLAYQDTIRKGLVSVANLQLYAGLDDAAIERWPVADHSRAYAARVMGLGLLNGIKQAGYGSTLGSPKVSRDVTQLYASVRAMQKHGWEHSWIHEELQIEQRQ